MKKILLVGNANTGKTTFFNFLTKSNEHIGNWHGVTVEEKTKKISYKNELINVVDLPGIYSLTPLSFEEKVAVEKILISNDSTIINICDLNNIERNIYLTLELLESGCNVILLVNEIGSPNSHYIQVDYQKLANKLGIKVVRWQALEGYTNADILDAIFDKKNDLNDKIFFKKNINKKSTIKNFIFSIFKKNKIKKNKILFRNMINKGNCLNYIKKINSINFIQNIIKNNAKNNNLSAVFCAIKIYENDENIIKKLNLSDNQLAQLKSYIFNNGINHTAKLRYGFIENIITECSYRKKTVAYGESKFDKVFLNKYLSVILFFVVMVFIFYITFFSLGAFLSAKLQSLFNVYIGNKIVVLLKPIISVPWVMELIDVAVIGGVGSLICFLPQIFFLFLFLLLLEDSGYLSRMAFLFESVFQKVGLSGKSVYTLIMGLGCSTSALITSRNMEDKNAKIKTALIAPYMSCSAKLPVYAVIGGAFFGASNLIVICLLYLLGVIVALLMSVIWESKYLKSKQQNFILEFPPYRFPNLKRISKIIFINLKDFLVRVGMVAISMNIIIWILENFNFKFEYLQNITDQSMLQVISQFICPIFAPLGFANWGACAALIAGFVAKEIIVSSIAMLNNVQVTKSNIPLSVSLTNKASVVSFNPCSALSYMVFCLLYCPCMSSISVMFKEIGKKWTIISIITQMGVAYLCAFVTFWVSGFVLNIGIDKFVLVIFAILITLFAIRNVAKWLKKGQCSFCKKCYK